MKTVILKNYYLSAIVTGRTEGNARVAAWLDIDLTGKERRAATKFTNLVMPQINAVEEQRIRILKKYATLDNKGNIKLNGKGGVELTAENMAKFQSEYQELINQDCAIDVTEENREMLGEIYRILDENLTVPARDGQLYEDVMTAFEEGLAE